MRIIKILFKIFIKIIKTIFKYVIVFPTLMYNHPDKYDIGKMKEIMDEF